MRNSGSTEQAERPMTNGMDALQAKGTTSVFEAVNPSTLGLAMVLVQDAIRMAQPELALGLIQASRARWGADPGLDLVEAMIESKSGRPDQARRCLETARETDPQALVTQVYAAMGAIDSRDLSGAQRRLREVIERCPDYPGVAGMLSSILMPGPNYREVLRSIHQIVRPKSYLEIGVETGATLALATSERIIGVDPNLGPLRRDWLQRPVQLYEQKSCDFFARYERRQVLADDPLDLVFIDGLHRFESALQDFYAVERWAHAQSVVIMHDALPVASVYAEPVRRTRFWVGDVWKAVYALLRHRPDLVIHVIPTVPSGLVVIRWREPMLQSPPIGYDALVRDTTFPELGSSDPVWPRAFPLVANCVDGYLEALAR